MLLKCITEKTGYWLTKGKVYYIKIEFLTFPKNTSRYSISNDKGFEHLIYPEEIKNFFQDVNENRDNILEQLGI